MPNPHLQRLLDREMSRKEFLAFSALAIASTFGIVGAIREIISHAGTPTASTEAESGTVTSPAVSVTDSTASGGRAIEFEAAGSYDPPTAGTYKPDSTTTGYAPYGITLAAYPATGGPFGDIVNGALTITAAGTSIIGYNIPARVVVKAANVNILKCKIRGASAPLTADGALVDCTNSAVSNCLIQDCLLAPDYPSLYWNGIRGHHFTAQRNDIRAVTDGIDIFNTYAPGTDLHVNILANYIHGLSGFGPDTPNNRPFTHNDCIQWPGGTNPVIRWNNFQGFLDPAIGQASDAAYNPNYPAMNANSVLQVTQAAGVARGLVFDSNWCYGGGATLNFAPTGNTAGNIGSVTNNKFGRDSYFQGGSASLNGHPGAGGDNSVTFTSKGGLSFTAPNAAVPSSVLDPNGGNVYEDNGHRILIRLAT